MKTYLLTLIAAIFLCVCTSHNAVVAQPFVKTENGKFKLVNITTITLALIFGTALF